MRSAGPEFSMKLMASGRNVFAGHGDVAFVLAVFVVHEGTMRGLGVPGEKSSGASSDGGEWENQYSTCFV